MCVVGLVKILSTVVIPYLGRHCPEDVGVLPLRHLRAREALAAVRGSQRAGKRQRAGNSQRAGNRRERERGGREGGRERMSTVCIERATQSVVGVCKHIGSSCEATHLAYTGTMG